MKTANSTLKDTNKPASHGTGPQTDIMKPAANFAASPKYLWYDLQRQDPPKRSPQERMADFREIYSLYDEEIVKIQASRCIQCGLPFCMQGCPLGNRIPEWLGLAAEGKFLEAAAISRSTSNMPEICARVCSQERLCESMCALTDKADAIPIGAIEKFINEYAFAHGGIETPHPAPNGFTVAVVGSGPAGLSCADELVTRGYKVTVFEASNHPGGLLTHGIPEFKLENSVVERRLGLLQQRGVRFLTGVTVDKEVGLNTLIKEYDAIFLSMGSQNSRPLDLPGADLKGVGLALPFLMGKKMGVATGQTPIPVTGKRVVVLGGGDTAIDCVRTAIRAGAKEVTCVYRREAFQMPAGKREYKNACEEGVKFIFLAAPIAMEGNASGQVTDVRCVRTAPWEIGELGRIAPPIQMPRSEFSMPADIVLAAFGFEATPSPATPEWTRIQLNGLGGVVVDENQMTSLPGVFSGGAQVTGPNLVVHAVRDGRKSAAGIHRFLQARGPKPTESVAKESAQQ